MKAKKIRSPNQEVVIFECVFAQKDLPFVDQNEIKEFYSYIIKNISKFSKKQEYVLYFRMQIEEQCILIYNSTYGDWNNCDIMIICRMQFAERLCRKAAKLEYPDRFEEIRKIELMIVDFFVNGYLAFDAKHKELTRRIKDLVFYSENGEYPLKDTPHERLTGEWSV